MRYLSVFAFLMYASAAVSPAAAQAPDLEPVVAAFHPAERLGPADAGDGRSCHAVLATGAADEPDVILAAYTTRSDGVVRLLRRGDDGEWAPTYDSPDTWALPGGECVVRLQDLDFDGMPEAMIYFVGRRASTGWIFKWDGAELTTLTPTETVDGRAASVLLNPVAFDLDHTGPLEIVATRDFTSPPPGVPAPMPGYVYGLRPAGYEVEKTILAVMGFRADVDPRGNQRSFRPVTDSTPPFTMRIVNGDREGRHRVTGVSIGLNNEEVVGSALVNAETQFTDVELPSLFIHNQVTAALEGPPDAYLILLVEDSTPR